MKGLFYILSLIFILGSPFSASAVTEKEMEQARTIAAKAYLRYANDGSGYLDELNPKSLPELEKKLRPKDKENLKAFKAIAVPSDYASWDKQKLVEYWGVTAFSTKGLIEKGRLGRNRAKKNIGAMTVTPPKKETPEPEKRQEEKKTDPVKTDAGKASSETVQASVSTSSATATDSTKNSLSESEATAMESLEDFDSEVPIKKADNHTWIYILILCILVGVVVALVVFASNVMKKNEANAEERSPSPAQSPSSDSPDTNALREKFAATLTSKNEEIRSLSKKLEESNAQNTSLKSKLEAVMAEAASLRSRLSEATKKIADLEAAHTLQEPQAATPSTHATQENARVTEPAASSQTPAPQPQPKTTPLRTIYLGRANAKGIFIRADRTLNLGNSIFRLDTSDGYAGSFRVANDPTVWEMALLTPRESLAGACVTSDLDKTDGMHRIVNDSAGTAIFEGGCWKVIRKAKIHFE